MKEQDEKKDIEQKETNADEVQTADEVQAVDETQTADDQKTSGTKKRESSESKKQKASDAEEKTAPSLSELIRSQVTEEDTPIQKNNLSLRKVLGGDILTAEIVRKQIWLVLLITFFLIIYIAEGYSYKKYALEIDKMKVELKDAKYKALSSRSDLTEHTRQSKVLDMLKLSNDSTLHAADKPPYIINVPE